MASVSSRKEKSGLCSFRQVDERIVSSEIVLMCWSPIMDLIALAIHTGEVWVHRLSWQKVWMLKTKKDQDSIVEVKALAWRPDGKILAIGYRNGISLCDVENGDISHSINLKGITTLTWLAKFESPEKEEQVHFYTDHSSTYLAKLPSLSKNYGPTASKQVDENVEDAKKLKDQQKLNVLVVGTDESKVYLYSFGVFLAGEICLNKMLNPSGIYSNIKVKSAELSSDLGLLTIITESKLVEGGYHYMLSSYKSPLFQTKNKEIQVIALKYGQIYSLLGYLSSTILAITEAWEDILLEIDCKLTKFAEEKYRVSQGSVSDDFLELLMLGTPTEVLERFLLQDLTEKGLKKLGHSIELSYSNIQKLVLKHLQSVALFLFYHLNEMKGMAMWEYKFGPIGLDHTPVQDALHAIASFLAKAVEIQQVIDNSMKNFKAFFRWLYSVILRLSDEQVPPEIMKVTQQDLNFVSEFLKENFALEWDEEKRSSFSLERVGQYLKDENLSFPQTTSQSAWLDFLEQNPEIKENKVMFNHNTNKSLIQQHKEVETKVDLAFVGPSKRLGNSILKKHEQFLFSSETAVDLSLSQIATPQSKYKYTAFTAQTPPCQSLYFIREVLDESHHCPMQGVVMIFGEINDGTIELKESPSSPVTERCKRHDVLDIQFYNEDTLSILLVESSINDMGCPVMIQIPIKLLNISLSDVKSNFLIESPLKIIDAALLVDKLGSRRMENMKAYRFSVSGTRKVACVLFSSRKRVRLFEMDVEDEDEEDDENQIKDNTDKDESLESNISHDDMNG